MGVVSFYTIAYVVCEFLTSQALTITASGTSTQAACWPDLAVYYLS